MTVEIIVTLKEWLLVGVLCVKEETVWGKAFPRRLHGPGWEALLQVLLIDIVMTV